MILRFVQGSSIVSRLIIAQEKVAMPFTPSHVESLTTDSKFYIGAHISGGVLRRPVGYDKAEVVHELSLHLDASKEQDAAFYDFLDGKIGKPYDWTSIIGFIVPEHFHMYDHVICSALMLLALRHCGWFASPLAAPAHLVSPRDLLLVISGRVPIPGV